jgi:hypothetical protein
MRLLVIFLLVVTLAACVPVPQRVKDEFSRYDGERPSNFQTGRASTARDEAPTDTPTTEAAE